MAKRATQKSNVAVRLPDELQKYLQHEAAQAYRTMTAEITMRLERTRRLDQECSTAGLRDGSPTTEAA